MLNPQASITLFTTRTQTAFALGSVCAIYKNRPMESHLG